MEQVKTKAIRSEDPLEHWSDIENVEGKVVMDLGCGWLHAGHMTSVAYFISRGAAKVIGVDENCSEINSLAGTYPDHTFVCKAIHTTSDLIELFETYRPQIVKMDIEGFEVLLSGVALPSLSSIEEIAVEYHNPECKAAVYNTFEGAGFKVIAANSFGYHCLDPNLMGVVHFKK